MPKETIKYIEKNAVDFFTNAIEEFSENPKYSVVHFCTAIELFLKHRIAKEHWSLIVQTGKKEVPDVIKFKSGDAMTLNIEGLIKVLKMTLEEPLEEKVSKAFIDLTKLRNKAVHFHFKLDEKAKNEIAKNQCLVLYHITKLIQNDWKTYFSSQTRIKMTSSNFDMKKHKDYL